ncbi:MAG: type II toxin-antitoxin system VapC family toxin [Pirellulaceae bacterium]
MLILDTDHLVEYQKGTSAESQRLNERLTQQSQPFGTTIISVEEIMRGWMAAIRRVREPRDQVNAYVKLRRLFQFFAVWRVLDFDQAAALECERLRIAKIRVGTMDMKIASIALARRATLLTRNRGDFERVPELVVEDWLA